MKKILFAVLLLLLITVSGCKKDKVSLEDLYGKYDFVKCVYVNPQNPFEKVQLNEKYKDKARYSVKENSFAYYENDGTTPTISLKLIQYKDVDINDGIEETEVKKIIKGATTRYDIYKLDVSQGYSFVFTEEEIYFIEFRRLTADVRVVWHIFEIEKRD